MKTFFTRKTQRPYPEAHRWGSIYGLLDVNRSRGYTLLFAVLVATLVLGVAVFITSISRKQFLLSETARESAFSFYNADSGMECAAAANSGISSTSNGTTPGGGPISCNGATVTLGSFSPPVGTPNLRYEMVSSPATFTFSNGGCAIVTFTTGYDVNNSLNTIIDSLGYNSCVSSGGTTPVYSPTPGSRTVERALELKYD